MSAANNSIVIDLALLHRIGDGYGSSRIGQGLLILNFASPLVLVLTD